jgi:hypothetical protein
LLKIRERLFAEEEVNLQCTLKEPEVGYVLNGKNMKVVRGLSLDQCHELCESQTKYNCISFD